MKRQATVKQGVEIAIRRPSEGAALLAQTLAQTLDGERWITREMKIRFAMMFISNLMDGNIERDVDQALLARARDLPLTHGLRLLQRRRVMGLKVLLALIMEELRDRQKLSSDEQLDFYDAVFEHFFPEIRFSELRRKEGGT